MTGAFIGAMLVMIAAVCLVIGFPSKDEPTLVDDVKDAFGPYAPLVLEGHHPSGLPIFGLAVPHHNGSSTQPQAEGIPLSPPARGLRSKDESSMNFPASRIHASSDATILRWIVDKGQEESIEIGPVTKQRLQRLADELDTQSAVLNGSGDVIAELISNLAAGVDSQLTYRIHPDDAERYHSAIVAAAIDANRRIADAGYATVMAEQDAEMGLQFATAQIERAGEIIDEQAQYIYQLQRAAGDLAEQVESTSNPEVVFVFVSEPDPAGYGVELASDLALALSMFK